MKEHEIEGKDTALEVSRYADDKQAEDIAILDLRGISTLTDFFVICTGTSTPHLKAIRREIAEKMSEEHGMKAHSSDGSAESQWLVMDFTDVIVHIFHKDKRGHYALEDLWSDAPRIPFDAASPIRS